MPIMAKDSGGGVFVNAPVGAHPAVCCDVVDLGIMKVTYAGKEKQQHKIRIVWQLDELDPDGKPFRVQKRYTLSLHEKAQLRKDLESWRGRPFEEASLKDGFDIEKLLSVGCFLNVIHEVKDQKTYANVTAIMPLPKGVTAPTVRDYVRVCDRSTDAQEVPGNDFGGITDDDVPF
jgi:hypothetical protein